jgi:hypothetical protein
LRLFKSKRLCLLLFLCDMKLIDSIGSAENRYKQLLEDFFISVYNEQILSSHGIDHHRRVWIYAKELLNLIPLRKSVDISQFPTDLLIACYMHDIGMSINTGPKHGITSKNLCIRFLNQNHLPEKDFTESLNAIEFHDNKEYTANSDKDDILKILSVADDLDAFGFTGVYRYSEIYLIRGVESDKMGRLIRDNAEKRYKNFVKSFGEFDILIKKHGSRYKILDDFFGKYNEQLSSYYFGTSHPSGYCGVIELLRHMLDRRIELKEIYLEPEKFLVDPTIRWYFTELEKELARV